MSVQSDFNRRDRDNRDNLPWRPLNGGGIGGTIADIAHSQNSGGSSAVSSFAEVVATGVIGALCLLGIWFYDRVYNPWKRSLPPPHPAVVAQAPPPPVVVPPVVRSKGQPWFRNPGNDTAYLAGLPPPEKVIAAMRTGDAYETAVRQSAAFERLAYAVGELMGPRQFDSKKQTPAEVALRGAYLARLATAPPSADGAVGDEERRRFSSARRSLQYGPDSRRFNRELLERTTDAAWRTRYVANWAELVATAEAAPRR